MMPAPEATCPKQTQRQRWRTWIVPTIISTLMLAISACSTVTAKTDSKRVTRESLRSATQLGEAAGATSPQLSAFADTSSAILKGAKKKESRGLRVDAAGDFLKTAADSYRLLASGSEAPGSEAEKALIGIHNNSLARFAELWATDPRRMVPGPSNFAPSLDCRRC